MLTENEKEFVEWWEANRLRKRGVLRQLYVGLPFGVVLIIAIVAITYSGWYKRADMVLNSEQRSLMLVVMAACLGIVSFIVIFAARHRWDQHEQNYRTLKAKEKT